MCTKYDDFRLCGSSEHVLFIVQYIQMKKSDVFMKTLVSTVMKIILTECLTGISKSSNTEYKAIQHLVVMKKLIYLN